jgi:hypothetical protein
MIASIKNFAGTSIVLSLKIPAVQKLIVGKERGYVKHSDAFVNSARRSIGEVSKMILRIPAVGLAPRASGNGILNPETTIWMSKTLPPPTI